MADYQQQAKKYLLAICRIYLIDFTCLNYTLPAECQQLKGELFDIAEDYYKYKDGNQVQFVDNLADVLRLFLPKSVMRILANVVCVFAQSGECDAKFVHGGKIDVIDRHDEL